MKKVTLKHKISKKLKAELDEIMVFGLAQQVLFQKKHGI
jgi:hypothetical protein